MKIEKTKILSSKGNLATVIHYPDQITEKLAILCSGFLDSKDYAHLVKLAEELSKRGYTVVRFDAIGTWESDGEITDYLPSQYLEDIKGVLDFMLKQSDYKYILLGGHSRGAALSISYASQDPRISLLLAIMPGSVMEKSKGEEWKKDGFRASSRDLLDNRDKKIEFRVPYSFLEDRDKYDVLKDIKKVKVPVILIAGELDPLVLPESVERVFNNANEPKEFFTIPNIGHDYRLNDDHLKLVNKKILELISIYDPS